MKTDDNLAFQVVSTTTEVQGHIQVHQARHRGLETPSKKLIVTSSAIDKMFEIFGPIFEQNANFDPIFEKSANFGPIFEKSVISNTLLMSDEVNIKAKIIGEEDFLVISSYLV